MASRIIPIRPKDDTSTLSKLEKDMLTYQVLFGCDNQVAFLMFHPEYMDAGKLNKAGKKMCREVFGYAKCKEYQDKYRQTLSNFCDYSEEDMTDISEERKERALQKLLHKAMRIVERGDELEPDDLKTVSEIFKKVGLLKDENGERIEEPRRYLPETCNRCRYKIFVEENIASGNIEDTGEEESADS